MPLSIEKSPKFEVLPSMMVPTLKEASRIIDSATARKRIVRHAQGKRVGCYIFALKKGKKYQPWYVGKTTRGFYGEVFNDSNCKKYGEAMGRGKTGRPFVFFVALPVSQGPKNKRAIDKLETMLVEECGGQNIAILNQRKNKIYKISIAGVVNAGQGKPPKVAIELRAMMGRA